MWQHGTMCMCRETMGIEFIGDLVSNGFKAEETKDLREFWRKGEGKEHVKERKAQSIAYWNERGNVVPAGKRNKGPREDL